jgi:hypothetical protein
MTLWNNADATAPFQKGHAMLKFTLIPAAALTLAATLAGNGPSREPPGACDVTSRAEVMAWSQAHPGQSYLDACARP